MIPIVKGRSPTKLSVAGAAKAAVHCAAFDANPNAYQAGKQFAFAAAIYGHPSVKSALEKAQHGKCCYCEVVIPKPYAYGHVEHWRPKAFSQQTKSGPKINPGYYWLAYDWDNLLLSCVFCNSSNKKNRFPLDNANSRARDHYACVDLESPSILKPDGPDDPRVHIRFHDDMPVGMTPRGSATIEILGLDSSRHTQRERRMAEIRMYREFIVRYHLKTDETAIEVVAISRKFLADAVKDSGDFSAMAVDFLNKHPVPI